MLLELVAALVVLLLVLVLVEASAQRRFARRVAREFSAVAGDIQHLRRLVEPPVRVTTPAAIHAAILAAGAKVGQHSAVARPDADLMHTGKFDEILYHAALMSGRPIRTTQDLQDLLTAWLAQVDPGDPQ